MTNDLIEAVNERDLDSLVVEVLDFLDHYSEIFNKIDNEVYTLPEHYKGPSCDEFIKSYNEFRKNYCIFLNNVKSYSEDLTELSIKMKENINYLAELYKKYADEIRLKEKLIVEKEVL